MAGDRPSPRQRAALAGCYGHTLTTCRKAVALLVDTIGTAAIFQSCPLERQLRDLTAMTQHALARPSLMEVSGGLWLGAGSDNVLVAEGIL